MKKLLLIALILTFAAGTAVAQQGGGPGQGGGNGQQANSQGGGNYGSPVDRLTELLDLTDEQIYLIEGIFADAQLVREQARAAAQEHREVMQGLILDVLVGDQKTIYLEHKEQREALKQALRELQSERGFGGGGGRGNGMGDGTGDCNG